MPLTSGIQSFNRMYKWGAHDKKWFLEISLHVWNAKWIRDSSLAILSLLNQGSYEKGINGKTTTYYGTWRCKIDSSCIGHMCATAYLIPRERKRHIKASRQTQPLFHYVIFSHISSIIMKSSLLTSSPSTGCLLVFAQKTSPLIARYIRVTGPVASLGGKQTTLFCSVKKFPKNMIAKIRGAESKGERQPRRGYVQEIVSFSFNYHPLLENSETPLLSYELVL